MARPTKGKPLVDTEYLREVDGVRRELRMAERRGQLCAPKLVRLALHDAITYRGATRTGGANGSVCTPRELGHATNAGLAGTASALEAMQARYERITLADVVQLAGVVGVEAMGGPSVRFTPGRRDSKVAPPEGRVPQLSECQAAPGLLPAAMERMELPPCYAVALSGGSPLGPAWADAAAYEEAWAGGGPAQPWSAAFFRLLLQAEQLGEVAAQPVDPAILADPSLHALVEAYAADEQRWLDDFAEAFQAVGEAGCGLLASALAGRAEPLTAQDELRRRAVADAEAATHRAEQGYPTAAQMYLAAGTLTAGAMAALLWWRQRRRMLPGK